MVVINLNLILLTQSIHTRVTRRQNHFSWIMFTRLFFAAVYDSNYVTLLGEFV